jgi:hypothetical protein
MPTYVVYQMVIKVIKIFHYKIYQNLCFGYVNIPPGNSVGNLPEGSKTFDLGRGGKSSFSSQNCYDN